MRAILYGRLRIVAGALTVLMAAGLVGCTPAINARPRDNTAPGGYSRPPMGQPAERQGMSTRNKVLLLAGAAALYYLYNKHKNRQGQGPEGRYYRSKNGRVYYRDLKTGQYQWVDPPTQPIRVPTDEYERYTGRSVDNYDGGVIRQAPPGW